MFGKLQENVLKNALKKQAKKKQAETNKRNDVIAPLASHILSH